ncbi:MAG: ATPase, partial [Nanoarchaeota archaeon]|nr:ATPase [Nanoarchaeota archaeon]
MSFYSKKEVEILKLFETSRNGLSSKKAERVLDKFGFNEIKEKKKISPIFIFLNQFNSVMIWILIGAIILSLIVGEKADSIVIGIIVILNAIFGFIQEYKAE